MATKLSDEIKALSKLTESEVQKIHAAIDAWFVKHFYGNSISQDEVKFNLCHAAKEDLKTIVAPAPEVSVPAKTE